MSEKFREWLGYLARLADQPLKLSKVRLAEERATAFSLTTRGWAFLAGEKSDDTIERLEEELIDTFNRLFPLRKLTRGRREGYVSQQTAAIDQVISLELQAGASLRAATRKIAPHQEDTHRRRQQRRRQKAKELNSLAGDIKKAGF